MKILAIDPGYGKVGIAVLEKTSSKENLLFSECFETSSKSSSPERLMSLGREVKRVIKKFKPEALAIEKLFFNDNQKTAMLVSEARGVIIYEATENNLPVTEFTPLQVKVAITSYGRGTKEQIKFMVHKLLLIDKKIKEDDEYDAIALGLTYFAVARSLT